MLTAFLEFWRINGMVNASVEVTVGLVWCNLINRFKLLLTSFSSFLFGARYDSLIRC